MARLMEHDYPGNVRELENIIEQAFVLCRGEWIELHHLPPELRPASPEAAAPGAAMSIRWMERRLIETALHRHHGNRSRAARELGIDASTLYRKLKSLEIEPPASDGRRRRR
jgi:DNA-binding NtrC family response regulator